MSVDDLVHSAFDFKKNRGGRPVFIVTQAKFEAVFVSIDRVPVKSQIVRVEVKAVNRVVVIGLTPAKFVEFKILPDELTDAHGQPLGDEILQFIP